MRHCSATRQMLVRATAKARMLESDGLTTPCYATCAHALHIHERVCNKICSADFHALHADFLHVFMSAFSVLSPPPPPKSTENALTNTCRRHDTEQDTQRFRQSCLRHIIENMSYIIDKSVLSMSEPAEGSSIKTTVRLVPCRVFYWRVHFLPYLFRFVNLSSNNSFHRLFFLFSRSDGSHVSAHDYSDISSERESLVPMFWGWFVRIALHLANQKPRTSFWWRGGGGWVGGWVGGDEENKQKRKPF